MRTTPNQGNWLSSLTANLRVFRRQGNELASIPQRPRRTIIRMRFYASDSFLNLSSPSEGAFSLAFRGEIGVRRSVNSVGHRNLLIPSIRSGGRLIRTGAYKLQLISDLEIVTR